MRDEKKWLPESLTVFQHLDLDQPKAPRLHEKAQSPSLTPPFYLSQLRLVSTTLNQKHLGRDDLSRGLATGGTKEKYSSLRPPKAPRNQAACNRGHNLPSSQLHEAPLCRAHDSPLVTNLSCFQFQFSCLTELMGRLGQNKSLLLNVDRSQYIKKKIYGSHFSST